MSIRQELRAIARPGGIRKGEYHLLLSEQFRLRNRVGLICLNDLEVHACRINVDQVSAIRRYPTVRDTIFVGIRCELLQLQFRESRRWLRSPCKPQTSNNNEQHYCS